VADFSFVHDSTDARLTDYSDLKDAALRAREAAGLHGAFIAEGETVVRHLAASRFPVRSLLVASGQLHRVEDLFPSLPADVPVYVADDDVLSRVVGFQFHRGVLACGGRVAPPPLADLLVSSRVLVICEDLVNPDNIGAVFRNTAALAGEGAAVLLSPRCIDPLYRKAVRVSMGHALRVPFARLEPWPGGLALLREAGFTVAALTPAPGAVDLATLACDPPERLAVMVGTEGPGLTPGALAASDVRVRIPMGAGVDSLNVGMALAVALSRLVTPR
jgi:tRNA G18 (ribose-2'-O)-methylase SpoU